MELRRKYYNKFERQFKVFIENENEIFERFKTTYFWEY